MPYEITIERNGVYKRFRGVVSSAEFIKSTTEVQSHPNYDRFRYSINDMLEVERIDCVAGDIVTIAAHNLGAMQTNARIRIATVTKDDGVRKTVGLLSTGRFASHTMNVFENVEDARAWAES